MVLHKYTQEEFNQLPIIDGIKQCPTGDYSSMKEFDESCSFGNDCSFGKYSSFGNFCSFGNGCSFGTGCSFGKYSSFGKGCSFSERCSFGNFYSFGNDCSFGTGCSFSERCSFGKGCKVENHTLTGFKLRSVGGLGDSKRTLYIWQTEDGFYAQAGCFFNCIEEFKKSVTEKYDEGHAYIKACDFLTSNWD